MKPAAPEAQGSLAQPNPFLDISTEDSIRLMQRGFAYRAAFGIFVLAAFTIAYFLPIGSPENDLPQLICALLITVVNIPYFIILRRTPK
ncbi:MAG: hypothetical protein ACE5FC_04975, partial [Myxococcota bacterium]